MNDVVRMVEYPQQIFNIMQIDYRLIGSFTDVEKCREAVLQLPHAYWIGVFPNNAYADTIPMWDRESFMKNSI